MLKWLGLAAALIVLAFAAVFGRWQTTPLTISEASITVTVYPGDSVAAVSERLAAEGVLSAPRWLRLYARIDGGDGRMQAGEYLVPAGTTPVGLLQLLTSGNVIQYQVTFPEGLTAAEALSRLLADPRIDNKIGRAHV